MADTTAPALQRTLPADNATGVSVTSNLTLAFSEKMKAGSGLIKIYKSDGTLFHSIAANDTSQVSFNSSRPMVVIDPSITLLAGTGYYVIIEPGAFEDLAGNDYAGLSSASAFNFTTASTGSGNPPADTTAPVLTNTLPNDNATNVNVSANLILTFNEAVKAGLGNIEIRNASGNLVQSVAITDTSKVTFSGNQLTINPGSDLSPGVSYYVTFASDVVRDLANNAFAGISSGAVFNFTTKSDYVDTTAPIIIFGSPDSYVTGNKNIVITFNEPVRAGSGLLEIHSAADDSLYRTISVTDTSQVSFSGRQVTINPATDLAAGNYYVTFAPTAFEDLYGHDLDGSFGLGVDSSAVAIETGAVGAGAFAQGIMAVAFASVAASVWATAIGSGTGTGSFHTGDTVAGNDATLDVSGMDLDPAINGTLISVTPTQVEILGTDGLTYRIIGINFITTATAVGGIGGTIITLIEAWSGSHILYSHYTYMLGLPMPGYYDIAESLDGYDTIIGSTSDDILFGFTGDDVISGREGNDQLNGGAGYDTFKFASPNAVKGDTIVGFEGGDKIDLSAIAGISFIGSSAFSGVAGQVRYAWSSGQTLLQIDSNGDGTSDVSMTLSGSQFALGETTPGSKVLVLTNDTAAPILLSTSPADNAASIPVGQNFYLTFNENIVAGTGNIEILRSSDNSVFDTIAITDSRVHFSGNLVSFAPHTSFATETGYYIKFATGVFQDVAGNDAAGISSKLAFNFTTVDITAPTLTGRTPSQGAMNVAPGTNIVLTFSEAVKAGSGVIEIRAYGTDALVKSISVNDASQISFAGNNLTINPATDLPFNGFFYLSMAPGVIKDIAGNNYAGIPLGQTHWVNFSTAAPPDTTAPAFIASTPSDNEIKVILNADLAIVFNEMVKAGTGDIVIKHISDGSVFKTISVTDTTQVSFNSFVIIRPEGAFIPGTGYYVTFAAGVFQDLAGNPASALSDPAKFNFWTTGSTDTVAPTLSSTTPGNTASNVPVGSNLVLTFSETVVGGWNSFEFYKADGTFVTSVHPSNWIEAFFNGNTVTINPPNDLTPGTEYRLVITGGAIQDTAGNYYVGSSFTFTTAGAASPAGFTGNAQSNTLTGGSGADVITGLGRGDMLTGGGGSDKFVYTAVSDSTGKNYDTITDFNASADLFDLWFQVTGVDASITSGSLAPRRFDSDLASVVGAAKVAAHHAVLFTPSTGALAGSKFLIVDVNGIAGYQAGADLVILLGANSTNLGSLTTADFV